MVLKIVFIACVVPVYSLLQLVSQTAAEAVLSSDFACMRIRTRDSGVVQLVFSGEL